MGWMQAIWKFLLRAIYRELGRMAVTAITRLEAAGRDEEEPDEEGQDEEAGGGGGQGGA